MKRFTVIDLPISGLKRLERKHLIDERGFFERLFCQEELKEIGWKNPIAQVNRTYTIKQGTVRGMHFQYPPYSEIKIISCIKGKIWDVVIDLRIDSPTFLNWHGEYLSDENFSALFVPEGFAHGFQTMTENVELIYFHSHCYVPKSEAGLNPYDPKLAINWPLSNGKISERDLNHPMINNNFKGIKL